LNQDVVTAMKKAGIVYFRKGQFYCYGKETG
jgi:hypothetical protein